MRVVMLTWCVALVACGGSDSSAPEHTPPSILSNQDNVCEQVAEVACYNWYECCSEGEIERLLGVTDPRTEDQCHSDVKRLCARELTNVEFSITNSRVTFDSQIMDTC